MRVLRSSEYRTQAWKNGGGTTVEIAVAPEGAGMDRFDWRVSMANVERPGPFSVFPEIDRSLAILEGAGMALHFADRGIVRLERSSPAFSFPGDLPVEATLPAGPVLDLNVMSRRGRWRHTLFHVAAISEFRLARRGAVTLCLVRGAAASVPQHSAVVSDGDTLILEEPGSPAAVGLTIDGTADLYIVDLWPVLSAAQG
jgi:environmental stress-induced protein Ves